MPVRPTRRRERPPGAPISPKVSDAKGSSADKIANVRKLERRLSKRWARRLKKAELGEILEKGDILNKTKEGKALLEKTVRDHVENSADKVMQYVDKFAKEPYAEEVILLAVLRSTGLAFQYADLFISEPYAKGVLFKAVDTSKDSDNVDVFKYAQHYSLEPYAKDLLVMAANVNPEFAFEHLNKYSKEVYAAHVIEAAARACVSNKAEAGLKYVDVYKNEPYGKKVLKLVAMAAAKKDPWGSALKYVDKYKDEPYAKRAIKIALNTALKKKPWIAIQYIDVYAKEPYAKKVLKRGLQLSLKVYPASLLAYADKYAKEPYAKAVLEKAVRRAVQDQPSAVVEYADKYAKEPYAKKMFELAIWEALTEDSWVVLKFADKYIGEPYAEEVIKKAAIASPGDAAKYANKYMKAPFGKGILMEAINGENMWVRDFIYYNKDEPYAKEILLIGAVKDTYGLLTSISMFAKQKYAEEVLLIAAKEGPSLALEELSTYIKEPYGMRVLEVAVRAAVTKAPSAVIKGFKLYSKEPYAEEVLKKSLKNAVSDNSEVVLKYAHLFKKESYAKVIIKDAVFAASWNYPANALLYSDLYENEEYAINIFIRVLSMSPLIYLENSSEGIDNVVRLQGNDVDKKRLSIVEMAKAKKVPRAVYLMDSIIHEKASFDSVAKISKDDGEFHKAVGYLYRKRHDYDSNEVVDKYRDMTLKSVQKINGLHNSPDKVRFKSVEKLDSVSLYDLVTLGEQEVFTSTFNGLFNRIMSKLKEEGKSTYDLLQAVENNGFRTFLKICSRFNRLKEFLDGMKKEQKEEVLSKFISNIEDQEDFLSEAVNVADFFGSLKDPVILAYMQKLVKEQYERVRGTSKEGEKIYGLLAGMFVGRAKMDKKWFAEIAKKYTLENVSMIASKELFSKNNINIQRHFFYNDEDGKGSFSHFLDEYRSDNSWKIEDRGDYVYVYKVKGGRKIEIYANKPDKVDEGDEKITREFEKKNIKSIVVVHRGHSYHADETIRRIPKIAKIVSLGSCGGYANVLAVLKRAPNAHILSTKGTGTMTVNDVVFRSLNEVIISGNPVNWAKFWARMEKKLNSNPMFKDYVPPHLNLGVMFLKAYKNLK